MREYKILYCVENEIGELDLIRLAQDIDQRRAFQISPYYSVFYKIWNTY